MQSNRSGQLVGTSLARCDVSHHYSLLNAVKQRGANKERATKWVGEQWTNPAVGRQERLCE